MSNNHYYGIGASSAVSGFLHIKDGGLEKLRRPCAMSEFQYLDRTAMRLELDDSSGDICQDLIYEAGVPLISERLKAFFDEFKIDYLFYKKILLVKAKTGVEEPYWLALPPRINCLNREKSEIDDIMETADHIVIDDDKIGRYKIFKLGGVTNLDIVVTQDLGEALKIRKFIGLHVFELD